MVLNILREHFDLGESELHNSTDSERPAEDPKRENTPVQEHHLHEKGGHPCTPRSPSSRLCNRGWRADA